MPIFQFADIYKKFSGVSESISASVTGFTFHKNSRGKHIPFNGDEYDDWIIGGRSLAEHCKSMKYVESSESQYSNKPKTVDLNESVNKLQNIVGDSPEPKML